MTNPDSPAPRPLTDLIGLDPDFTGGLSAEEYLRRQRCGECDEALSALTAARAERDHYLRSFKAQQEENERVHGKVREQYDVIEHAKKQRNEAIEQAKQAQGELAEVTRERDVYRRDRDAARAEADGLRVELRDALIAQRIVAGTLGATPAAAPKADEWRGQQAVDCGRGVAGDWCRRPVNHEGDCSPKSRTYRDMPVIRCVPAEHDIAYMAHVYEVSGEKVVCPGVRPHSVPLDAKPVPAGGEDAIFDAFKARIFDTNDRVFDGGEDGSGTAAERRTCSHAYVGNVGEFTCDLYAPHDGKRHWNSLAEFGWSDEVPA